MPSDTDFGSLSDIARNIALAREFVSGLSFEAFKHVLKAVYAVTRSLEIISEASRRFSTEIKNQHPEIAWSQMAGAGNIYRHDYLDVRVDVLWRTVHEFLTPLLKVVDQELERLKTQR